MSKLHQIGSYIHYWLHAVDRHSLQAPFIFNLYDQVINEKTPHPDYERIEKHRKRLQKSQEVIELQDFGAGSQFISGKTRAIKDIAAKGITRKKYSRMLYRLCKYLNARNIIELGTSLGINTLYLSLNDQARVTTFEGSPALCNQAKGLFENMDRNNIQIIQGNIDEQLATTLATLPPVDVAFVDANHRYEATVNYFNILSAHAHQESCFVFDDIHWSKDMEAAWKTIKSHPSVTLSVDLYQMGLVFFNPDLRKQDYVVEF